MRAKRVREIDQRYLGLNLEVEEGVKEMSSRLSRTSKRRARETQRWHSRTLALQSSDGEGRAHWRREAFAVSPPPDIGAACENSSTVIDSNLPIACTAGRAVLRRYTAGQVMIHRCSYFGTAA
ncbi:Hypothetical predicted protein [Olea europaea subsp. europaea]|uniref:Uncharacterized protein n=1 Tax=Olea europaea subsp. europaea TaxID=158383 RepID=A0A8S0RNP2_OLEEU|nr:Hypothetical predicted protein [Olea europaea subsp. europaea]